MNDALGRKLRSFCDLSPDDMAALRDLCSSRPRRYGARVDMIVEGDAQTKLYLLLDGWACRYKQLKDGRRQLLAVALPGDMCVRHSQIVDGIDHSMGALTASTFAELDPQAVDDLCDRHPSICRAILISGLADMSIQREWTLNVGQRDATERIGHLLCELYFRQMAIDLTDGTTCPMPLTQADIGDATGITNVHVNRSLMALRRDRLVDVRDRRLTIHDLDRLMQLSMFEPDYLRLSSFPGRRGDARLGRGMREAEA